MKGGNTDSKAPEVQGFDYDNVDRHGTVNMKGGKKGKGKSSKFSEFDFEKEWKEFEESYNQKYGGASKNKKTSSTKKKPAKKTASSTKKKPAKKGAKKPKRKTQRGGDDAGATFAPAQFFDEKATMSAPSSDKSTGSLVDGLYPHAPNNQVVAQTGGAKKKSSKTKKAKTATKTTKPKKDTKKKDSKKESKKTKTATKSTGKKTSVLDKIKKFFAM
jgi:hypothetical protein